jgi:hypothetical protein
MKNSESPVQAINEQKEVDALRVPKSGINPAEAVLRMLPPGADPLAGIGHESPAFREFTLTYRHEDGVYCIYCSFKKIQS